jgi:hypothetical protein
MKNTLKSSYVGTKAILKGWKSGFISYIGKNVGKNNTCYPMFEFGSRMKEIMASPRTEINPPEFRPSGKVYGTGI